jgi:hypothetical protein
MTKKIGVLISTGFGAGWSTWNSPECALDQELVGAIEVNLPAEQIKAIAERNWPKAYLGGLLDCDVVWVDEGTAFRIEEYDGAESIHFPDGYSWQIAK